MSPAPCSGALWMLVLTTTFAVALSFGTGEAFRPSVGLSLLIGGVLGYVAAFARGTGWAGAVGAALQLGVLSLLNVSPLVTGAAISPSLAALCSAVLGMVFALSVFKIMSDCPSGPLTRHEFEGAAIRFLTGFGYLFFTAIVIIPFYVMVMTSLKNQAELLLNPLDFSLDLSLGWDLFRSYFELFAQFNFGSYLWTSFFISVLTVLHHAAVRRARGLCRGAAAVQGPRGVFSRSILLIYMVPMIVLALPIYIAFSMAGLRNTIFGIVLIYPVTTIPVALYMLQGYFRGLPAEIEEAGLMDGLSRIAVIWKITLPLSLPALASVSLYVFMIAWNEFLLAFMLLDDPSKFTLTRGVAMLNRPRFRAST